MTRERAKELLPIMEAFAAGKVVQSSCEYALDTGWFDITEDLQLLENREFRIKPEPRVMWVVFETTGQVFAWFDNENSAIQFKNYGNGRKLAKFQEVM